MDNQYDIGAKEDFDNMTEELGTIVTVYPRNTELTYEGQEDENTEINKNGVQEVAFIQPLEETHQMITSGQFNVGDVRFTFKAETTAVEEGYVSPDNGKTWYKVINMTKTQGMSNNIIVSVKAYGKIVPGR